MIYIPDAEIDRLLMEDIAMGDLTTRSMGLARQPGVMRFKLRRKGVVSGVDTACRMLRKLGLQAQAQALIGDGEATTDDGQPLLTAHGMAQALHQGWKAAQNLLEWSSGISQYMASMLAAGRACNRQLQIACTRKSIPGTRLLATQAALAGGGIVHRCGTAETVLVFANHRRFFPTPFDWEARVAWLKQVAPEKKIVCEAASLDEARTILQARPDVLQLDKLEPGDVRQMVEEARHTHPACVVAAAGGIHLGNVAQYAAAGVPLIVSSAPYYAPPADIGVEIFPESSA